MSDQVQTLAHPWPPGRVALQGWVIAKGEQERAQQQVEDAQAKMDAEQSAAYAYLRRNGPQICRLNTDRYFVLTADDGAIKAMEVNGP